jgi:exodeoxyribonuclease V beta subunit
VDLVFEHSGRYYLLDWKSNSIEGGYDAARTLAKMKDSRYDLQYRLYAVALSEWLAKFGAADRFGGAIYLFVRGLRPDRPGDGVFADLSLSLDDARADCARVLERARVHPGSGGGGS